VYKKFVVTPSLNENSPSLNKNLTVVINADKVHDDALKAIRVNNKERLF